jgi:hypothetical protein
MAEHVVIEGWEEFEEDLRSRLKTRNFTRMILVRNFSVERIDTMMGTGTDRDAGSQFWNAPEFDHPNNAGMELEDITYAHRVNWHTKPFTILNLGEFQTSVQLNLTDQLTEHDAVAIYDILGFERLAINEHKFAKPPSEVLMFVYTIRDEEHSVNTAE